MATRFRSDAQRKAVMSELSKQKRTIPKPKPSRHTDLVESYRMFARGVGEKHIMTKEADDEVARLNNEIEDLNREYESVRKRYSSMSSMRRTMMYQLKKILQRQDYRYGKITDLEGSGLTNIQKRVLLDERHSGAFKQVSQDRSLGVRDAKYIGKSVLFNLPVSFDVSRYTGLFRSVKGMHSIAGDVDVYNLRFA